jgi:hypothetical protein
MQAGDSGGRRTQPGRSACRRTQADRSAFRGCLAPARRPPGRHRPGCRGCLLCRDRVGRSRARRRPGCSRTAPRVQALGAVGRLGAGRPGRCFPGRADRSRRGVSAARPGHRPAARRNQAHCPGNPAGRCRRGQAAHRSGIRAGRGPHSQAACRRRIRAGLRRIRAGQRPGSRAGTRRDSRRCRRPGRCRAAGCGARTGGASHRPAGPADAGRRAPGAIRWSSPRTLLWLMWCGGDAGSLHHAATITWPATWSGALACWRGYAPGWLASGKTHRCPSHRSALGSVWRAKPFIKNQSGSGIRMP